MDLGLEGKPLKTARSHLQRRITGLKTGVNGTRLTSRHTATAGPVARPLQLWDNESNRCLASA